MVISVYRHAEYRSRHRHVLVRPLDLRRDVIADSAIQGLLSLPPVQGVAPASPWHFIITTWPVDNVIPVTSALTDANGMPKIFISSQCQPAPFACDLGQYPRTYRQRKAAFKLVWFMNASQDR